MCVSLTRLAHENAGVIPSTHEGAPPYMRKQILIAKHEGIRVSSQRDVCLCPPLKELRKAILHAKQERSRDIEIQYFWYQNRVTITFCGSRHGFRTQIKDPPQFLS